MKTRNMVLFFLGIILSLFVASCAGTKRASVEEQRRSYMLHDKSEYSRNKGKFKSTDHYSKQHKKNMKKMKRKNRRR